VKLQQHESAATTPVIIWIEMGWFYVGTDVDAFVESDFLKIKFRESTG
jgi:hypothetical protein